MPKVRTFINVWGEIHGEMWMPAVHAFIPVRKRIEIKPEGPFFHGGDVEPDVRAAINSALDCGDLRNPTFTPETTITIDREYWLPSGRITLAHGARLGDRVTVEKGAYMVRSRAISTAKLGRLYVSECDGHDYCEE